MKCGIKTCTNEASWQLVLVLHPHPNYPGYRPARGNIGIVVCQECRASGSITVDDVISDESWAEIEEAMSTLGWVKPDRRRNELDYERISEGPRLAPLRQEKADS